jgi:hypothetical protein
MNDLFTNNELGRKLLPRTCNFHLGTNYVRKTTAGHSFFTYSALDRV